MKTPVGGLTSDYFSIFEMASKINILRERQGTFGAASGPLRPPASPERLAMAGRLKEHFVRGASRLLGT